MCVHNVRSTETKAKRYGATHLCTLLFGLSTDLMPLRGYGTLVAFFCTSHPDFRVARVVWHECGVVRPAHGDNVRLKQE